MVRHPTEIITEERKRMRGGTGSVRIRHFFRAEELACPIRLLAELRLSPGDSIGLHPHHGEEEIFVVLSGKGEISEDGVAWEPIGPGDATITQAGRSHTVRGTEGELVMIAIIGSCA
ncbi:MAG TPA: cupin [Planctomycetes bacterium]|nr:cupin [Planctomycetota bacterium]